MFIRFMIWSLSVVYLGLSGVYAQTLVIDSPVNNSCVPNINLVQLGPTPGEVIDFERSNVPLSLFVSDPNGDNIVLSATVNGQPIELSEEIITIDVAGENTLVDNLYIPADQIDDGTNITLVITATSPAGVVSQSVIFDLDRLPPNINFSVEELSLFESCDANASALIQTIQPQAVDLFDPNPTLSYVNSDFECEYTRVITATDHCGEGNSQEIFFQMRRPVSEPIENYDIEFFGVESNGFYLEASIDFGTNRDFNCFQTEGVLSRNGAAGEEFTRGNFLSTPGDYQLTASLTDCAGNSRESVIDFKILEQPYADAGGPYQVNQGERITLNADDSFCPPELGGIISYTWNFDVDADAGNYNQEGAEVEFLAGDDGTVNIGVRIETASGEIREDFTRVQINDVSPLCDAGGPYQTEAGVFFEVSGDATPAAISEPIEEFHWDFGESNDPNDLTDQRSGVNFPNPSYFYQNEGDYEITLTVYDQDSSCTDTAIVTVQAPIPYVRNIYVVEGSPLREGVALTFTAEEANTNSATRPIQSFRWDWGYNNQQSEANGNLLRFATHTFPDDGIYDVCLTIDDGFQTGSDCTSIELADVHPRVFVDGPIFAIEGEDALFHLDGTRAGSDYDPLDRIVIDWGDGVIETINDPSQTEITHRFEANGTLTVQVEVFDEDSSSTEFYTFFVDDVSPTVAFSSFEIPQEGISSAWSAADSQAGALSDEITSYVWDWGDGNTSEGMNVEHTWADNGSYTVSLTVYDEDSSSTQTRIIQVLNRAPYNAEIITAQAQVDAGEEVSFEVVFEDVAQDFVSIYWRMGDGRTFNDRRVVTHSYQSLGVYTVRAILSDEDGGETEVRYDIEVIPAGPILLISALDDVAEGEEMSFDLELRAAIDGEGNFDGPVNLSVLRVPHGMTWEVIESNNEVRSRKYRFTWQTGAGDAGTYTLRFKARSPSGIERSIERTIAVLNTQDVYLTTLSGTQQQSLLNIYKYVSDSRLQNIQLETQAVIPVGRGMGDLLQYSDYTFVSLPQNGQVAVVDPVQAELVRKIPINGQPYRLIEYQDELWVFDAYNGQISTINRHLKVYRKTYVEALAGTLAVIAWTDEQTDQDYFFVLTRKGEILVLDAHAVIDQRFNQMLVQKHNLDSWRIAASTLPGVYRKSKAVHGNLYEWHLPMNEDGSLEDSSTSTLVVVLARDIIALNPQQLLSSFADLSPYWIMRSAFALDDLLYLNGSIWASSQQGLRRFDVPSADFNEMSHQKGEIIDPNAHRTLSVVPAFLFDEPSFIVAKQRSLQHVGLESNRILLEQYGPEVYKILMLQKTIHD